MRYGKYSGRGNFFSLPNEVFLLGLSAGELAVYSFLRRCENHRTHQCWPSIKTIGEAVGMSENTVRKYIRQLEERNLITTEPHRGDHQTQRSAQRESAVYPPADPGGDRPVLRPPAGGIGVGHGAPACGETSAARCAPQSWEGQSPCPSRRIGAGFGPLFPLFLERGLSPSWALYEGRKKKQDKRRGRRWRLRPVTTARSAGSCGAFFCP